MYLKITPTNICSNCCYCIEDNDNFGTCCRDNIYRHIKLNQHACKYFCGDDEDDFNMYSNQQTINDIWNDTDDDNDIDF